MPQETISSSKKIAELKEQGNKVKCLYLVHEQCDNGADRARKQDKLDGAVKEAEVDGYSRHGSQAWDSDSRGTEVQIMVKKLEPGEELEEEGFSSVLGLYDSKDEFGNIETKYFGS